MNRILLAFMALLAGLCAQVAPTAARLSEDTQIGATADLSAPSRQAAAQGAVRAHRPNHTLVLDSNADRIALGAQGPALAGVLIGIDRTRE